MAIDLCNKSPDSLSDLQPDAKLPVAAPPLTDLLAEQREALNFAYRTTLSVDPRFVAGAPAAWASDFGYALDKASVRIDSRTDEELRADAFSHPDPVMREQALFEYADRDLPDAFDLLVEVIRSERNREV